MRLEITGVAKTYANGVQALKDVSLAIPNGIFGLLGPNGSGKTTLMRSLATLQEVDAGAIRFDDIDILREKGRVRRILGYLPQDFGVYPNVSAVELLDHLAILKGLTNGAERERAVRTLLVRTNLWETRKRKLGTYSGGMKQRFGVAQALLGDPQLIIVDEPTAGLDPEERVRFLNLLHEIGESVVVILSTHIVEDVSDLCTQMAVIKDGAVRYAGNPREAVARLQGKIWRKAVARPDLPGYLRDHEVVATRLAGGEVVVHVRGDGPPDADFTAVAPDLRDAYFTILGDETRRN